MAYQWPYIPSDEMYNEKMDTRNEILRAWAEKGAGKIVPNSWNHVQELVHAGLHNKVFHIKDKLTCQKSGNNIDWVVIGKDIDIPSDNQYNHTMTLQTQDCIESLQFDAPEAFYYTDEGLAAGTYYFTIDSTYDTLNNDLSAYQFTLSQPLPAGGQLIFNWQSGTRASAAKVGSFANSTSTTAMEILSVTEGTSGINLGELKITVQPILKLNALQRIRYGSNNYKESAIRQWLNSNKAAGQVWTAQTGWDRPPAWAETVNGFMYDMDADFLSAIKKTHITAARAQTVEGGNTYDEMDDYFFLLSKPQIYGGYTIPNIDEGNIYPYFKDYSQLLAAGTDHDTNRRKARNNVATSWLLRSPYVSTGYIVWCVYAAGSMDASYAANAKGVAAACNIIG
jgi:hypothetical protein